MRDGAVIQAVGDATRGGVRRKRDQPHPLAAALEAVRAEVAPVTLLAAVQEAWPAVAGAPVAGQADPVAEREGVVTVACRSATWAQELDLMQVELLERLRGAARRGTVRGGASRGSVSAPTRPVAIRNDNRHTFTLICRDFVTDPAVVPATRPGILM